MQAMLPSHIQPVFGSTTGVCQFCRFAAGVAKLLTFSKVKVLSQFTNQTCLTTGCCDLLSNF
jgi:hypothetical protein